jgi:O-antigen/teichoic acid export membrane protein
VGFKPVLPAFDASFVSDARELIRGGFPFLTWAVTLCMFGNVDRILLGFFVPASEIGSYSAALRIVGATIFLPSVIVAPLYPVLSRSTDNPELMRRTMHQALRLSLLLTVPISAGIAALAPAIPSVLGWSSDFDNAIPLIVILALHIPIVSVDMMLATVIMAVGRESTWGRLGLAAALLNIGLNLAAIPLTEHFTGNGAIGAAAITVQTELFMFFAALYLVPKHLIDPRIWWYGTRVLLAGVATALAATLALALGVPQAMAAGAVAYGAVVLVLRTVDSDDMQYVTRRFGSRGIMRKLGAQ